MMSVTLLKPLDIGIVVQERLGCYENRFLASCPVFEKQCVAPTATEAILNLLESMALYLEVCDDLGTDPLEAVAMSAERV